MANRVAKPEAAEGYIRVSTEAQATEGMSLAAQRSRITAWCAAAGLPLADVHVDAGISGKRSDNRPGVQAAIESACRTRRVLVVYSLSRLARSTKDAIAIAERLDAAGAQLVSVTEQIDTTTAMGRMFFRLLAILAEFERELTVERTMSTISLKRAAGERISRHLPFGKSLAADGRTLIDAAEELEALSSIAVHRADGMSVRAIARMLDDAGVRPKNGRRWSPSSVHSLLKREAERAQAT